MPAIRAIPTGAPTNVPSCHSIFFLRLHGFLPQNVQPDGLQRDKKNISLRKGKAYLNWGFGFISAEK